MDAFEASELGHKYPQSVKVWRDAWERFVPFLQFPPAAPRVLYITNAIESLNAELRKATRNRGQFPTDAAALKTLWLMICNIEDKRAAQRAKKAQRAVDCNGYFEGGENLRVETSHQPTSSGLPQPIRTTCKPRPAYKQTDTLRNDGYRGESLGTKPGALQHFSVTLGTIVYHGKTYYARSYSKVANLPCRV